MDIPPPPPPPPPPSPDDVPPPGPPSFDKNPYQQDNPYAAPTQAAMPAAGQPQQQPPAYPGAPTGGYGYPGAQPQQPPPAYPGAPAGGYGYPGAQSQQPPPAYPGAPAGGYGYPAAPGVPQYPGQAGVPQYPGQPGVPQYPGQPGMPQYPGQPGYYLQPGQRNTNSMSIAALVLGLLPCVPLLGAIFGFIGLSQSKKRGERGKGMAVTGIIGSGAWLAIIVVLIVLAAANTGNTQVADLKAGQCFSMRGEKLADFGHGEKRKGTVDVVSCAKEHDAEVVAVYEIQADGDAYPGEEAVRADAATNCPKYARAYLNGKDVPDSLGKYSYLPTYGNWDDDLRSVVCFVGNPDGKYTGTVKSMLGGSDGSDSSDTGEDDGGMGV